MGFEFTKDYRLIMTDDGPEVFVDSPYKIDDTPLTPAKLRFKYGMSRSEVIHYMKNLNGKVKTIVSHEPIITPLLKVPLQIGKLTMEDIELNQLVMDGHEVFIDEFGLQVYSCSEITTVQELKDLRYD